MSRSENSVKFGTVEIREYPYLQGGSLSVPEDGSFPLGIDWYYVDKILTTVDSHQQNKQFTVGEIEKLCEDERRKKLLRMMIADEMESYNPPQSKNTFIKKFISKLKMNGEKTVKPPASSVEDIAFCKLVMESRDFRQELEDIRKERMESNIGCVCKSVCKECKCVENDDICHKKLCDCLCFKNIL